MKKSVFKQFIYIIILLIIISSTAQSQEEMEVEFGEFTLSDFSKTTFEADPNIPAVVLFEKGHIYFNEKLELIISEHRRIKILSTEGYKYATVRIPFREGRRKETLIEVEGVTAYIDQNGKVVTVELDSDDIFPVEYSKDFSYSGFTFPAIQPGCIIEYFYKKRTPSIYNFPTRWIFQKEIPVLWSEYQTDVPSIYRFAVFEQQIHPFFINETNDFNKSYTITESNDIALTLNGFTKRYVMKDLPAVNQEFYMKSPGDAYSKVIYQLAAYDPPFSSIQKVTQSWKELGKELMELESFGERLECPDELAEIVKKIRSESSGEQEIMLKIYDYVNENFTWNNHYSIYASDLQKIFETKKGDTGDLNFVLAAMLKKAGIEFYPVILATRDKGTIYTDYPIIDQFNTVVVYVKTVAGEYLLDATDQLRPHYLLPENELTDLALLILPNDVEWIRIVPTGQAITIKLASFEINVNGSINGIFRITNEEYSALDSRKKILELNSTEEYLKSLVQSSASGVELIDVKVTNKDTIDKAIVFDGRFYSTTYSQVSDKVIYFSPYTLGKVKQNPFTEDIRKFDIDFMYRRQNHFKVNISIPQGFKFSDYPQNITINTADNGAVYTRETIVQDNQMTFSSSFIINKTSFPVEEYSELKKFYSEVNALEAELITVMKAE
ncbi:MAG: DUF3857 domain-containing transglutaminase family protein [Ignavibacteriales bacterium]|nr:MAG: DUF3857 domain-containing transglutaminase family protein [Ignavibacteriales bacterium]